jgi:plasmid stabilization system protein ParE
VTIVIAPRALKDISEAYDYTAADSPRAAERLLERLNEIVQRLAAGELSGPQVRLRRGGLVYRWSLAPYRLYYRRTRRRLVLLRVYHQARQPIEQ